MGNFGAAHGWGEGAKISPILKICHTYPTILKPGTVIPSLKNVPQKNKKILLYQEKQV